MCGKLETENTKHFIHIFINGLTWDNRPANMKLVCFQCMTTFKANRMNRAVKTLYDLGLIFNGRNWVYNNHMIKKDLVDYEALEYQVEFLRKENKELKALLKK